MRVSAHFFIFRLNFRQKEKLFDNFPAAQNLGGMTPFAPLPGYGATSSNDNNNDYFSFHLSLPCKKTNLSAEIPASLSLNKS